MAIYGSTASIHVNLCHCHAGRGTISLRLWDPPTLRRIDGKLSNLRRRRRRRWLPSFLPSFPTTTMGAIHESTTPSPFPSAHTDTLQESVQCAAKVTVRIHAASRGYAKDTVSRPLKIAEHLLPFFSLASLRSMRRSFRTSVGSNGTDAARAAAARRRLLSRIPPPSFLLPSYIVYTAAPFQKGSIDREQSISLSLPARRLRVELLHPL